MFPSLPPSSQNYLHSVYTQCFHPTKSHFTQWVQLSLDRIYIIIITDMILWGYSFQRLTIIYNIKQWKTSSEDCSQDSSCRLLDWPCSYLPPMLLLILVAALTLLQSYHLYLPGTEVASAGIHSFISSICKRSPRHHPKHCHLGLFLFGPLLTSVRRCFPAGGKNHGKNRKKPSWKK